MDKGVYCLVFHNHCCSLKIGSLGQVTFPQGWHVYTGSAQGPGGLARISRHIRVKREGIRSPHWHVDYLLVHPGFELISVACAQTSEQSDECRISGLLTHDPVPGFGCSDCRCRSHLAYFEVNPEKEIILAFSQAGLDVTITTLNIF
ncbi:MAG: GIY-YIG nuclease family protein [Methanoregulaceae archaeon]|jgi:Uri superfamily endonuclease|nr:GIY-YIG nuclease family protein [Methanoregulaceae archaeon]